MAKIKKAQVRNRPGWVDRKTGKKNPKKEKK